MPETVDQEIRTLQSIFWSERDPDGLAFASLADAFRRKGEVREALDLLTDGMSRHPDYATGHVVATRLYVDQGMHSEAELSARRVLELDPENLVALSALVSVLSERGAAGEAARHKTALFAADPDSEEARAVADIDLDAAGVEEVPAADEVPTADEMPEVETEEAGAGEGPGDFDLELSDEWTSDVAGAETPLDLVADETGDEAPEIGELVPETMYHEEETFDLDDLTVEPEGGSESDAGAEEETARDMAGELAADPLDLANLSIAHEDESSSVEEDVVELADLAPDEEDVVELAALAPDEPVDEDVVDLAALAPDDEADEDVVDLAALAPDQPEEEADEDVVDLAALAPDDEAEEQAEEGVVELAALAPDASVEELADEMELADAVEGDEGEESDDESTEPVYTRTLADLYIKQGFHDKALDVLKHIQERQPDAPDLAERIEALEKGEAPEIPAPTTASTTEDAARAEDDMERRARELAEPDDHDHDMDTPFAWDDGAEEPGDADEEDDGIGAYLEGLLEWENRSES